MRRAALLCSCFILVAGTMPAFAQEVIRGLDFWETTAGQTFVDMNGLEGLCGFQILEPDPRIPLRGIPLESSPFCPGQNLGNSSTIVRRQNNTVGLNGPPGGQATIPIEIVGLHLESVGNFKVDFRGQPELWRVDVTLSTAASQPIGSMTIRKTHPNGGTFDSQLPVRPHFIFTRVDACPAVVRCQVDGPIIQLQSVGAPWSYMPNPQSPVLEVPGCTTNFFPGVIPFAPGEITPETGGPPNPGVCHPAGAHQHCVTPPPPPALFQNSWQMAVHFTFSLKNISQKVSVNDFHIRNARYIPMGIPAGAPDNTITIKSVSICDTTTICNKTPPDRWARVNWDSTNANFRREAWWVFPPVPPKGTAPEMDIVFSVPCWAQPGVGAWYEVDYEVTEACNVVDRGTFRFHCPPMAPCPDSTGCKHETISVPPDQKGSVIELLGQSFPNPSRLTSTMINFRLERETNVTLRVFDAQGRVVKTLVNAVRPSGSHVVEWDGRDESGTRVKAGAYFYQIDAAGRRQSKKMIIVK